MKIQKNNKFYVYFIISILFCLFGIVLLPVWTKDVFWYDFGNKFIYLIISLLLLIYLICVLFKCIKKNKDKKELIADVVEFTLISVLTLLCFINQFTDFITNFLSLSRCVGLVLYVHGVIGLLKQVLFKNEIKELTYRLLSFLIHISFVSLGVLFFFKEIIKTNILLYCLALILFILTIMCIVIGIISKPKSQKKKK